MRRRRRHQRILADYLNQEVEDRPDAQRQVPTRWVDDADSDPARRKVWHDVHQPAFLDVGPDKNVGKYGNPIASQHRTVDGNRVAGDEARRDPYGNVLGAI